MMWDTNQQRKEQAINLHTHKKNGFKKDKQLFIKLSPKPPLIVYSSCILRKCSEH